MPASVATSPAVAPDDGYPHVLEKTLAGLGAEFGRAGADRVEYDRRAELVRALAGELHCVDPLGLQRADVEHERPRDTDHFLDFLARVRHYRQRADAEGGVGGLVHHDVVGYAVDERFDLAYLCQVFCDSVNDLHYFLRARLRLHDT